MVNMKSRDFSGKNRTTTFVKSLKFLSVEGDRIISFSGSTLTLFLLLCSLVPAS